MLKSLMPCVFAVGLVVSFDGVAVAGQDSSREVVDGLLVRIKALSNTNGLSVAQKQQRLQGLDSLAKEIEKEYRTTDSATYAIMIEKICGAMQALNVPGLQRLYLSQHYAMAALEKRADIPLDAQCALVRYVQQDVDAQGTMLSGNALADLREQQTILWLDTWKRVETAIDKNWDPQDRPSLNVIPPARSGIPAGGAPEDINDPQLRAAVPGRHRGKQTQIGGISPPSRCERQLIYNLGSIGETIPDPVLYGHARPHR